MRGEIISISRKTGDTDVVTRPTSCGGGVEVWYKP
jgi:hypothetical protein